jgi:hypothetical protein
MLLHGHEIAVSVQQPVSAFDAEGRDDKVCGLPHGDAKAAQAPIIVGAARCQIGIEQSHQRELPQLAFHASGVALIASALQDFQKDQVSDKERL